MSKTTVIESKKDTFMKQFLDVCASSSLDGVKKVWKKCSYKKDSEEILELLDNGFYEACANGKTDTVKYFLSNGFVENHPTPQYVRGISLVRAALDNHTDVVDTLLKSPDLPKNLSGPFFRAIYNSKTDQKTISECMTNYFFNRFTIEGEEFLNMYGVAGKAKNYVLLDNFNEELVKSNYFDATVLMRTICMNRDKETMNFVVNKSQYKANFALNNLHPDALVLLFNNQSIEMLEYYVELCKPSKKKMPAELYNTIINDAAFTKKGLKAIALLRAKITK